LRWQSSRQAASGRAGSSVAGRWWQNQQVTVILRQVDPGRTREMQVVQERQAERHSRQENGGRQVEVQDITSPYQMQSKKKRVACERHQVETR